jgi:hypothetical protein
MNALWSVACLCVHLRSSFKLGTAGNDGIVLLNFLKQGQRATVLQLPAAAADAKVSRRAAHV